MSNLNRPQDTTAKHIDDFIIKFNIKQKILFLQKKKKVKTIFDIHPLYPIHCIKQFQNFQVTEQ